MEERIAILETKLRVIESRLPSWEARVKTLERNNPLEARLRSLEAAQLSAAMSSLGNLSALASATSAWMLWPFSYLSFLPGWARQFWQIKRPSHAERTLMSANTPRVCAVSADVESQGKRLEQDLESSEMPAELDESCRGMNNSNMDLPPNYEFCLKIGLEGYSQSLVLTSKEVQTGNETATLSDRRKIALLHQEACRRQLDTYIDPHSAYEVFTAHHLKTRDCCGSGCRHCPWGHRNVPGKIAAQEQSLRSAATARSEIDVCSEIPAFKESVPPKSKLYTRKGDAGYTNLYNEEWILKSRPVYEAIGDVDELNSSVGLAHALLPRESDMLSQLEAVQAWLLEIGSALCTPRPSTSNARKLQRTKGVCSSDVSTLEAFIDVADARIARLTNFILPGGSAAAAALHVARTVCRRAERHTWPLLLDGHGDEMIGVFLNRLSDYLFVAARLEAHEAGMPEKQYRIERRVDRWQRQIVNT